MRRKPSLKLSAWPSADQAAWSSAIATGDIFDGRGAVAHWRPPTRATNIHHYGRWLAFLGVRGWMDPAADAGSHCDLQTVREYIAYLRTTLAPVTVASSIIGLSEMLKAMAPGQDWRWLRDIANRLKRTARPSRDKRSRMQSTEIIYNVAFTELSRLKELPLDRQRTIVGFRNALMLAVIAACPLRAGNFAALQVGYTMLRTRDKWSIFIPSVEHKTHYDHNLDLPAALWPYLEYYWTKVRLVLVREPDLGFLWLTWQGTPYDAHGLYLLFQKTSPRYLGKRINPHLFRDCAATMLTSHSLSAAAAGPGLLGHRDYRTTEKSYVHARALEASRQINLAVENATRKSP